MPEKYISIDGNDVVTQAFDNAVTHDIPMVRVDVNGDPIPLHPITDAEYNLILSGKYSASDFNRLPDGALELRVGADDDYKTREVDKIDASLALKAFVMIMLDEINILRLAAGLNARTMAQLKTAMKNKI